MHLITLNLLIFFFNFAHGNIHDIFKSFCSFQIKPLWHILLFLYLLFTTSLCLLLFSHFCLCSSLPSLILTYLFYAYKTETFLDGEGCISHLFFFSQKLNKICVTGPLSVKKGFWQAWLLCAQTGHTLCIRESNSSDSVKSRKFYHWINAQAYFVRESNSSYSCEKRMFYH